MNLITISGSPHIHTDKNVKKIMWGVIIAMIPAMLHSFYYFGIGAIIITSTAILSCLFFEYFIQKYLLKGELSITDGSAIITGILLAFNVPSNLPWWEIVIGSLVAIGVAKMTFGGLGKNIFNPALVGRVFLLISFPVDMTSWPIISPLNTKIVDVITGPTSLGIIKEGLMKGDKISELMNKIPSYFDMFSGNIGGSMGEISALALIVGGLYMIFKKIITWHIPISFIFTTFIFTGILWKINPENYANPLFHILSGGLLLGAIFMATDLVTCPMTLKGQLVFGFGCGILTVLIRIWGAYPEGVSFAILLMNVVTPIINKTFKPKRFGEEIKNG